MKPDFKSDVEKITERHIVKKRWRKFVTPLACVVALITICALIFPAIAMEKYSCGIEEHTHIDTC